jgi:hypothetical protein
MCVVLVRPKDAVGPRRLQAISCVPTFLIILYIATATYVFQFYYIQPHNAQGPNVYLPPRVITNYLVAPQLYPEYGVVLVGGTRQNRPSGDRTYYGLGHKYS